ncbi:MAG: D-alanine--D-alanine ligase [Acidobacteriota bacterium]|nr:MAG: D-alanine--D-alanine ligase [Acidobacteriota bacterium]
MLDIIILCGGRSAEHEVSFLSARSVVTHFDRTDRRVQVLGIRRDGSTFRPDQLKDAFGGDGLEGVEFPEADHWISYLLSARSESTVVFPVLHGPYGEDGTVQGLLELLDLPYVGSSVCGSAVGMNKIHAKALLQAAGLPTLPSIRVDRMGWDRARDVLDQVSNELKMPVFVKPANMGSSVGVSRCLDRQGLTKAIQLAFEFDDYVLVEQGIDAREIEVSVLGNEAPEVSIPGEIIPADEFYSYDAKYLNDASQLLIPAPLDESVGREVQRLGVAAYEVLQLEGMARIDFLLDRQSLEIWINEANTIPGFTRISMYPKLWEASGLPYSRLLERLVQLAVERHSRRSRLKTDRV